MVVGWWWSCVTWIEAFNKHAPYTICCINYSDADINLSKHQLYDRMVGLRFTLILHIKQIKGIVIVHKWNDLQKFRVFCAKIVKLNIELGHGSCFNNSYNNRINISDTEIKQRQRGNWNFHTNLYFQLYPSVR